MPSEPLPSEPTSVPVEVPPPLPASPPSEQQRSPIGFMLLALLLGGGIGLFIMNPGLLKADTGPSRPRPNYQRTRTPAGSFKTSVGPLDGAVEEMSKTRRGKLFKRAAELLHQ